MLLFDALSRVKKLEEEIKNLTLENAKIRNKNKELERDIDVKQAFIDQLLQAKENGCHQGNYCAECVHSYMIVDRGAHRCKCAYGQCDHYEKWGSE